VLVNDKVLFLKIRYLRQESKKEQHGTKISLDSEWRVSDKNVLKNRNENLTRGLRIARVVVGSGQKWSM
jgi:hypothetical protein